MSHLHLPDGVFPSWLWISGLLLTMALWFLLFRIRPKEDFARRLPLLGMMAAVMILGASVEIVPIAYHVNLTVISGILLGPSLVFLATFLVNIILALFGHGGITVIGLNTLILSLEGILGYLFFHLLWRIFRRLKLAVFLATLLALFSSTMAMIAMVGLGASHYEEMIHGHSEEGLFDFKLLKGKEGPPAKAHGKEEVHLARFVAIVLPLGFVGWVLEGVITVLITNYLHRLRPDLLGLEP